MVGGDGGGSGGGGWDVASPGSRSIGFRSKKRQRRGKGTDKAGQQREGQTHTANNDDDQQRAKWGAPVQTTGTSRLVGNQPGYTQDPQTLVSSSTYNGDCSVRRSERANRHGRSTRGAFCLRGRNRGRAGAKGDSLSLSLTYGRSTTVGFYRQENATGSGRSFLSLSLRAATTSSGQAIERVATPRYRYRQCSVISVDARMVHFYVGPRSSSADQPGRKQRKNRSSAHHGSRNSRPLCATSTRGDTFDQGMTGIPHPFGTCTPFPRRYRSAFRRSRGPFYGSGLDVNHVEVAWPGWQNRNKRLRDLSCFASHGDCADSATSGEWGGRRSQSRSGT